MLNFVNYDTYINTEENPDCELCYQLELGEYDLRKSLIAQLKTAHEVLFAAAALQANTEEILFAASGILLSVSDSVEELAQLNPFSLKSGEIIHGFVVKANDVGTASYLLLNTIEAVKAGTFDTLIRTPNVFQAYIERHGGYPMILAWETQDGTFLVPETSPSDETDLPF
jgi:hypothetical protein